MSSNENPSSNSSPGEEGIRLPPISFLSSQLPPNKYPSSNLGISNFLNDPTPTPEEQPAKRIKTETTKVKENKEIEAEQEPEQTLTTEDGPQETSTENKPEENHAEKGDTILEASISPPLAEEKEAPPAESESQEEVKTVDKPVKRTGPPVTLNTEPIKELLSEIFPSRQYLGTIIYNPTTTWETLQTSQLYGLKPEHHDRFQEIKALFEERSADATIKYIPTIPPLGNDYINSVVEVKIPYAHIRRFRNDFETVIRKRELWGGAGGVYTDDSDVLCVLTHLGLFSNNIDLKQWNEQWVPADVIKPHTENEEEIEDGIYGDLSVEILLLPRLPLYPGYFANEINSRSWLGNNKHRGLSIAVHNIKWESCGTYLRDKSIFKRYHQELIQDAQENSTNISQKQGWSFNYKYYKELKQKYSEKKV